MNSFIRRYLAHIGTATLIALAYHAGAEAVLPGQQHPDPWLPALHFGAVAGPATLVAVSYIRLLGEWRTERRGRRGQEQAGDD